MRVLYDYQIFETQIHGGISRYFYEIIKGIQKRPDFKCILPLVSSSNYYIKGIQEIANEIQTGSNYYNQFMHGLDFPGKWRLYQQWIKIFPHIAKRNQRMSIENIRKAEFEIFHPTDLDDYFLDHIGSLPFVITFHDMIDEYFPEYLFHVHTNYKTSIKENIVKKAAGIIAVSESTKRDLLQRFSIDEKKIRVIHHGVSLNSGSVNNSCPFISGRYLLYVGKRVHYKNFYFLLQSIQPLLIKDRSLKVVCVGAPFNKAELAYFKDLSIAESVEHRDADDLTLGNLYQHALAFIYPSLYEGFGMPILEAFKFGCPVILSNTSSLPEVAGDAGLYFYPKDIESILSAVNSILDNNSLREEMIKKGYERLKLFSWESAVEKTLQFYKSIC